MAFTHHDYIIVGSCLGGSVWALRYMRILDGTITFKLGRSFINLLRRQLVSVFDDPAPASQAYMEEATDLAQRFADNVGGMAFSRVADILLGSPSTAHVLGGARMGSDASEGVLDHHHEVFGYPGPYVVDGSPVSANPGVNPSLTITALAERAMSFIPAKAACDHDSERDAAE